MNVTNAQTMDFKNPFDSWKSIVISLYMTLIGYGVLVGIPVISTAWVTLLGFSEVEVGRVAGADLGGLSICLLNTFGAAHEEERVELRGPRCIQKKNNIHYY